MQLIKDNLQMNYFIFFFLNNLGTVSPCQYDEGSPLVQKTDFTGIPQEIVVGIMSKNQGCADPNVPTIYTRLVSYYTWLLETAGPQPLQ